MKKIALWRKLKCTETSDCEQIKTFYVEQISGSFRIILTSGA